MNKYLIYSMTLLLFVTAASASFSSDNDKIGVGQIISNDLAKDMSTKIDQFLAAEMREKPDKKIRVLIELEEQQKAPFDASKVKSLTIESQSALASSLESMSAENIEQHWIVNVISAKVTAQNIGDIAAHTDVKKVWLDREIKLTEPEIALSAMDYGDGQIGAPQVWDIGYNGTGIKIAILDTGIDDTHPDLDEGKVIAENDFTDDGTTDDLYGHGTHCAGIAAGEQNTTITGVAPGASLINAKVLNQYGIGHTSWIISGIEWSMDQDADILSMSLGGWQWDGTGRNLQDMAVTNAVNAGYVVVISAGNEGPGEGTIGSPAVAYRAIAVAASDSDDRVADFSSRGPTGDGRVGINVAAPGVYINSTNAGWETGDHYKVLSGTSMACPHVAGAAALLLEAYPDLTPEDVEGALMNGADDLGYEILEQGAGRLNVTAAYLALTNGTLVDDPQWFVGRVYQGSYMNTFTIYNNNDSAVTVNITSSSDDAGDWITLNTASLPVSATGTANFDATMSVITTIPGAYNGNITVNDGWNDIIIPVSVNVMQTVDSTTIEYIDDDFMSDTESNYYGGDFVYYTFVVQAGITNLNLGLNWTNSNNDLDFILFNPNGEMMGVPDTENVPEMISIDNPSTGKWMVTINARNLKTFPETYNLTINPTGENTGEIIDFTVTPEDVEIYNHSTFEVDFTNTGTKPVTANGTIDIYHIGEYGKVGVDELILTQKTANAGGSINWTMEWTASLMVGNYEATARLYYDKTVTEKTGPFYITDTMPPAVTATKLLNIWVNNGTVLNLNATITDTGSGVKNATVDVSGVNETITTAMLFNTAGDYWTNDSIIVDTINSGLQNLIITAYDNASNYNDSAQVEVMIDNTMPIIISADADPSEIEANGTDNTMLNVIATDDLYGIASVSVNLSVIGGSPSQAMINNSSGVWQFPTNTTTAGIFELPVNVTDNAGNSNTSANITLNATDTTSPVVIDTSPGNLATDLKIDSSITATFSEPVNSSTLNDTTVKVYKLETGKITGETFENVSGTWNSSNFQGFSHAEELKIEPAPIDGAHRTIVEGNLIYSTRPVPKYYQVYIGEGIEVTGSRNYSVISWLGDEYIAVNGQPEKLTNLVFEQKTADTKTLQVGDTWDLGDGYSLKLLQIDMANGKAWIELHNSSESIDQKILDISSDESAIWELDLDIANEPNVPFFVTYLNKVTSTAIELKYTWLISQDATVIGLNDSFGVFEVTSISSDAIRLENKENVSLTKGSTIPLVNDIMFEVEDNSTVRYSLVGTGEIKTALEGDISYDSASRTVTFDPVSNLMYSTTYIPYITTGVEDLVGNGIIEDYVWEFNTISYTSPYKPPSGGGGGGGGSSGEPYANIEFKDAARVYISRDAHISFTFDEPENDIQYVNYKALTSAGYISATIELLKDTSIFAKEAAPGIICKNINIWVGKSGYATEAKIENPVVGFKVEKKWIQDNDIEESSIKLNRHHGDTWTTLPTAKTDEDSTHLYFESQTPGFSPFAITGEEKTLVTPPEPSSLKSPTEPTDAVTKSTKVETPPEPTPWGSYLIFCVVALVIIAGTYMYIRKRQG